MLTEGQHEESLALNITRLRVRVDSLKPLSTHAVIVVDPVCTYQLSVRWDFGASIGSVLHAYISELVGFGFVVLLLTLARISKTWEESGAAYAFFFCFVFGFILLLSVFHLTSTKDQTFRPFIDKILTW